MLFIKTVTEVGYVGKQCLGSDAFGWRLSSIMVEIQPCRQRFGQRMGQPRLVGAKAQATACTPVSTVEGQFRPLVVVARSVQVLSFLGQRQP